MMESGKTALITEGHRMARTSHAVELLRSSCAPSTWPLLAGLLDVGRNPIEWPKRNAAPANSSVILESTLGS